MNKFIKALTVLAASVAIASPASAQLSGEVSVSTTAFNTFSAKAALEYGFTLSSTVDAYVGGIYANGPFGTAGSGSIELYAGVGVSLSQQLFVGAELQFEVSSLGLTNDVALRFIPSIAYTVVDSGQLTVVVSGTLPIRLVQGFGLSLRGFVDGYYVVNQQLGVAFGLDTGVTFVPVVAWRGVGFYVRGDYQIIDPLLAFVGFDGFFETTFGYDVYGGLRFDLSDSFALKLTAGFNGAFRLTLAGLYNR